MRQRATPDVSVRIGVSAGERIVNLPLTLADSLEFFHDEGVDVEFETFPLGVDIWDALRDGRLNMACSEFSSLLDQDPAAARIQAFVNLVRYPGYVVVAATKATRLRRIEDLAGASVGVAEAPGDARLLLGYTLRQRGVVQSKVSIRVFPKPEPLAQAVAKGEIDAAILPEPFIAQLGEKLPQRSLLLDMRESQGVQEAIGWPEYPGPALAATEEWIGENNDTCLKVVRAVRRSLLWIAGRTAEQIVERIPPEFRDPAESAYLAALVSSLPGFSPNGALSESAATAADRVVAFAQPSAPGRVLAAKAFTDEFLELAPEGSTE